MGQKRKCPGSRGTSVLPSGADIVSLPRHVRLVPTAEVAVAAYSNRWCRETRRRVTLEVLLCGGRRYRSEVAIGRQAIQKCENRVQV
jgi:hypothetical protein